MSHETLQLERATSPRAVTPLREVWTIAWPTVLTMTSYTSMQFTDKLMVGHLGPVDLAAQSNGGIWSFAVLSFVLGVVTVVNTYVSQHLGAGTPREGVKYAWAAFWLGLILWAATMLPYAKLLPWLFSTVIPKLYGQSGPSHELLHKEAGYAQILVCGSILLLTNRGLNQFFFGLHRPRIVTIAAIAGNVTNFLGNYFLMFGRDGVERLGIPGIPWLPAMGVYGSAVATVVGTAVELSIPLSVFLGGKLHRELGTRSAWRPRWDAMRDLLKLGWPAAAQWGNELVCWAIFMTVLVGRFGDDHMAACSIAFGYMGLSFMPAVGFSVATNSLVGKYIGAGQPETAVARVRLTLALAMSYMTACAILFLTFRHDLVRLFLSAGDQAAHERIVTIGGSLLVCTAVFQTFDALGVIYTGALRGAGDTVWPGVMTMIYSWVFIVGGGVAMVFLFPQLESIGPWIAAAVYIIIYGLTMWLRFTSGNWRNINLLETTTPATAPVVVAGPETDAARSADDMAASIAEAAAEKALKR